ncbi:MAG: hypothetical protein WCJ30_25605, partial [Deltaproteobacteria bacterium]
MHSIPVSLVPAAMVLALVSAARPARAQHRPATSPWGISPDARYVPQPGARATGPASARVEFVSNGPPQTIAVYAGSLSRGTARESRQEAVYRDLCTTPCTLRFVPRAYELYTHGPGTVSGVHRYAVPEGGVRFHLRTRPATAATVAGVSIAVAVLATLVSIALFANAELAHADSTPGWIVLG